MRKLASIQTISEIREIPDAEFIELALIKGWQVVVKKNEFKVGDQVVYFEIDSWIPSEIASFLTKSGQTPKVYENVSGERLRTVKLRKQLSQGLILPLSILEPHRMLTSETLQWGKRTWDEEYSSWSYNIVTCEEGADVTELLGILKWERPLPTQLAGNALGNFPYFVRKTDQERVQNCWDDVKAIETEWVIEEKLDGSSCSIYCRFIKNVAAGYYEVGVASRNLDLKIDDSNENNSYVSVAKREGYLEALPKLGLSIAIQGELCGPGIQGNKYKLTQVELFVFDVWMIDENRYAIREERWGIIEQLILLGIDVKQVPHLGTIQNLPDTLTDCLKMAEGKSNLASTEREGIVFKSYTLIDGQIQSFKAISNKFLLEEKE